MKHQVLFFLLVATIPALSKSQQPQPADKATAIHGEHIVYGDVSYSPNFADKALGTESYLDLPSLECSLYAQYALTFDLACSRSAHGLDLVSVLVSENGGQWETVYNHEGVECRRVEPKVTYFDPSTEDWKPIKVLLNGYDGDLRIRFHFQNGSGNDLYLDNVRLTRIEQSSRIKIK